MIAPISVEVIAKLRALRKIHKFSAQKLADEVTALGFPVSRTMLANWEGGRKATLPIDFVALAAKVLDTTPEKLLNEPVVCPTCKGIPPVGFTCNTCSQIGGAS